MKQNNCNKTPLINVQVYTNLINIFSVTIKQIYNNSDSDSCNYVDICKRPATATQHSISYT